MKKFNKWAVLFALPGLFGFLFFYVMPFFVSLYYSLINNTKDKAFVWLKNYTSVLSNEYYRLALGNTMTFTTISVISILCLSFVITVLLLSSGNGRYARAVRSSFIFPVFVPSAAILAFWGVMFDTETSVFITLLNNSFPDAAPLFDKLPIYLLFIWKNIGLNILIYMAGILKIPNEINDASMVDGATTLQKHWFITLPILTPLIFFTILLSIVQSFKVFREVYLLYGSYPDDNKYFVSHYITNKFTKLHYPELSAGTIIFCIIILLVIGSMLIFRNLAVKHYEN